jgi:hypothetical protein
MLQLLNRGGYGVAARFAGLHYRIGEAAGTSGCSTPTMETVLDWLATGKLSLEGFACRITIRWKTTRQRFFRPRRMGENQ